MHLFQNEEEHEPDTGKSNNIIIFRIVHVNKDMLHICNRFNHLFNILRYYYFALILVYCKTPPPPIPKDV